MEGITLEVTENITPLDLAETFNIFHPVIAMAALAVLRKPVLQAETAAITEAILDTVNEEKVGPTIIALVTVLEILISNVAKDWEQENFVEKVIEGWQQ